MIKIVINGQTLKATKTEAHFAQDCVDFMAQEGGLQYAQSHISHIIRCAPNEAAANRRKEIALALGLKAK